MDEVYTGRKTGTVLCEETVIFSPITLSDYVSIFLGSLLCFFFLSFPYSWAGRFQSEHKRTGRNKSGKKLKKNKALAPSSSIEEKANEDEEDDDDGYLASGVVVVVGGELLLFQNVAVLAEELEVARRSCRSVRFRARR